MVYVLFCLTMIAACFAVVATVVVTALKGWAGWGRVLLHFFLFAAGGFVTTTLLFFAFIAMYYAGGGH